MPAPLRDSPSTEDYLERIYELVSRKGYARAVDIASSLSLKQSSVTKMIQRLSGLGYLNYEKYRGLTLTARGEALAKAVWSRHKTLAEFFRLLGVPEETLQRDIEGIEHHVSASTLGRLRDLLSFFEDSPQCLRSFRRRRGNGKRTK